MPASAATFETARSPEADHVVDVLVVGGGLVGLPVALALDQAGLAVAVVDREPPSLQAEDAFDGRGSAIAAGSARILAGLGVWHAIEPHAAPILDIRVTDGPSRLFLHYDHRDVAEGPLGWIVENRFTRRALHAAAANRPGLRHWAPASLASIAFDGPFVRAALADGRRVRARLAVACDGRGSPTREAAGIGVVEWRYGQSAIVCAIAHERPHGGVAHEHFLPPGPFAVLPLPDGPDGSHRSSIVWTEREALVPAMMALPDAEFADEMQFRFGDSLGRIRLAGRRWSYPLGLLQAKAYTGPRLALAGDAAHAIHPIAGQGLNLALRDVAALAEAVVDAARLGLDIGAAETLERYARWRRFDGLVLAAVTDALNRLFSNDLAPLRLARDLGLGIVNQLPPLKRLFMRHAMGTLGDLPRLARGEKL